MSKLQAAIRVAVARESEGALTPEEELMVAPPDEVILDDDVAAELDTVNEEDPTDMLDAAVDLDDGIVEAEGVIETLKGDGTTEPSELAVAVAQERLYRIVNRFGSPTIRRPHHAVGNEGFKDKVKEIKDKAKAKWDSESQKVKDKYGSFKAYLKDKFSKELKDAETTVAKESLKEGENVAEKIIEAVMDIKDVASDDRPGPYSSAEDLISDAEKDLEFMRVAANEGVKEFANRIAVNLKNFARWKTSYLKEVNNVVKKAQELKGTKPKEGAVWNNRLRIAHFTDKDKKHLTTADQFNNTVKQTSAAIKALTPLQANLANAFKVFGKGDGSIDLGKVFAPLPKIEYDDQWEGEGKMEGRAVCGSDGLYGESAVLINVGSKENISNWKEFRDAVKELDIDWVTHWEVKDLPKDINLPAMSADEVARNAQALTKVAAELEQDYAAIKEMADMKASGGQVSGFTPFAMIKAAAGTAVDAVTNRDMLGIRAHVNGLAGRITKVCADTVDRKATGLNCLMDYYKWSLSQAQKGSTE